MSTSPAQVTAAAGRSSAAAELATRGWSVRQVQVQNRPTLLIERGAVRRLVRVSAKRRGTWQTSTTYGVAEASDELKAHLWIFVDLGEPAPAFFVVPEAWMAEDIYSHHAEYLARHGGRRKNSPGSTHHKITKGRIDQWRDRWDLLANVAVRS